MSEYVLSVTDGIVDGAFLYYYDKNEMPDEVVRCRDCKRFGPETSDHEYRGEWWCELFMTDLARPDGFCAWGEWREDR